MKLLSAVVPCYNEEENVPDFYREFMKTKNISAAGMWNWRSGTLMTDPGIIPGRK